jgi:hypothetical protein
MGKMVDFGFVRQIDEGYNRQSAKPRASLSAVDYPIAPPSASSKAPVSTLRHYFSVEIACLDLRIYLEFINVSLYPDRLQKTKLCSDMVYSRQNGF